MTIKHEVAWTLVAIGLAAPDLAAAQRPASTYFLYDADGRVSSC